MQSLMLPAHAQIRSRYLFPNPKNRPQSFPCSAAKTKKRATPVGRPLRPPVAELPRFQKPAAKSQQSSRSLRTRTRIDCREEPHHSFFETRKGRWIISDGFTIRTLKNPVLPLTVGSDFFVQSSAGLLQKHRSLFISPEIQHERRLSDHLQHSRLPYHRDIDS